MKGSIEHIGPRLKEIRQSAELSLREVARQLGVSPSFVSQIENGKSQPSVATLFGFATLLGVPMDALFESQWNGRTATNPKSTPEIINRDQAGHPHPVWDDSQARISTVSPGTEASSPLSLEFSGSVWPPPQKKPSISWKSFTNQAQNP